MRLPISNQ